MPTIHEVKPREVSGRDTILRFTMQHQAAAYAALEVLDGGEIDKIYCDYHDDFVVRRQSSGAAIYHFYQVKTKEKANYQWSFREVFALKKSGQKSDGESLKAVQNSFAGKLLLHALTFKSACREVTLLTNVHFSDEVEIAVKEIKSGIPTSKAICFLIENLGDIFEVELGREAAIEIAQKLSLQANVSYIGDQQKKFALEAREAIFKYSEIDLSHGEASEIAAGLVGLVQKKSIASLQGLNPSQLDDAVGVGLNDLLSILSISPKTYGALVAGEDPKALRTASFIQRRLSGVGASDAIIEYASQKKVDWDIWLRTARHTYPEMDINFLLEKISEIRSKWLRSGGDFSDLREEIVSYMSSPAVQSIPQLNNELLLGGIMADWVRKESA